MADNRAIPVHLDQGATFVRQIFYKNTDTTAINVSGYTARFRIGESYDGPILMSVTQADYITVNGVSGEFAISVPPSVTDLLTPGTWLYDFDITSPSGVVTRLISGPCFIHAAVEV